MLLLVSAWFVGLQAVVGPAPVNPLVETLQQAGSAGQIGAVMQHCLASGVLGPFWEEVRWEGCLHDQHRLFCRSHSISQSLTAN